MRDWDERAMSAAIAAVKSGMSVRKASKQYSVPKSTLGDRITGKIAEGAKMGKKKIFSETEENELIACAKERADMGLGFSKDNFLRFAGAYATKKAIQIHCDASRPSDMWWRDLKSRNNTFSLRSPEATATIRHDAMTRDRLSKYFESLGNVLSSYNLALHPERIWNMDETGINLFHKPGRVVAKKGAKAVHAKASGSREMITVIACANAAGGCVPPHFVMPGKTKKTLYGYDTEVALEPGSSIKGANYSVSDSGWTKDGIGRLWFRETFIKNIGPARPQLLICDGHASHNNVEFLDQARQEDIVLVELPSHTSNWTQPLDRTVFKSLKSHWNTEVGDFIRTTGVSVGHKQFLRIFAKAWQSSLKPCNIKSGFAATGIFPFDPKKIPSEAYKPSESGAEREDSFVNEHEASLPVRVSGAVASSSNVSEASLPIGSSPLHCPNMSGSALLVCPTTLSPSPYGASLLKGYETLSPNPLSSPLEGPETISVKPAVSLPVFSTGILPLLSQNALQCSLSSGSPDLPSEHEGNVVSSITFSLPLNVEGGISDLPGLAVDREGNLQIESSDLCLSVPSLSCETEAEAESQLNIVSPKTALEVVESTLSHETLLKFQAALLSGKLLKDPMFDTWKMYQSKIEPAAPSAVTPASVAKELFPIPKKVTKSTNVTPHFVLTSDEIYLQKKNAQDEKKRKETEKETRKVERERKRLIREKEKEDKISRKKKKQ